MKTLVLTRHAKSDWNDPSLDDHDRPLNARGRKAAPRIGAWIAAQTSPDTALVSTARRATETFDGIASALPAPPTRMLKPQLYHAGPETMLQTLRTASGDTVLMIGHNPGIAFFAEALLASSPDDPDFDQYPTGATLVAGFDIADWSALRLGTGRLLGFTIPRHLPE